VAFTLGALALSLFLFVARGLYLHAATNNGLPYDAAAAVYDTLLRFLHTAVRAVLAFSIVVLIAVFFAGPSRLAVWFRSRVRWTANWLGSESERAGWRWLARNEFVVRRKAALRVITATLAFLVLVFWKHPTPLRIVGLSIATLIVLGIIEFFGREPTENSVQPATSRSEMSRFTPSGSG
jgi:Ni,Fe-hydrogenase I cytochrome b subunit